MVLGSISILNLAKWSKERWPVITNYILEPSGEVTVGIQGARKIVDSLGTMTIDINGTSHQKIKSQTVVILAIDSTVLIPT